MSIATFDTLTAARALEDAGMESAQAAAVVETVRVAVVEGSATKADIAALRTDIADLRAEVRTDIAKLETRLTWRMFLVVGGLLALATTLDRLLGG